MPGLANPLYRVSIKALVLDNDKRFLLQKEESGVWDLPGGGLEFGEKPKEALEREVREEMGLRVFDISSKPDYFITVLFDKYKIWGANVIYKAKINNIENFTRSIECTETRFFSSKEALENEDVLPNVKEFAKIYIYDESEK